jgi:hypothetical protein
MAEIAVALGAAKVAVGLVQDVHDLVGKIRSGVLAKNDEAKRELDETLDALKDSLRAAGRLAKYGEEYAGVQQDVLNLLWETERVRGSLRENREAASDSSHPQYSSAWETIAQLFDSVQQGQGPLFLAFDNRIVWLNETDKAQIQQRLQSAGMAVEGGAQAIKNQASADADMHIRRIVDELRRVQASLNDTIRKGIFGALGELSQ